MNDSAPVTARPNGTGGPGGGTASAKVARALREMALQVPLDSDEPLPPEPRLVEYFGVSRGTLRRATEELVREGLLRADPGRGTFVRKQAQIRTIVADTLRRVALPDSRWDLDVTRFVPDFVGSDDCHRRLMDAPVMAGNGPVFIAPDNSLRGLIVAVLAAGRTVLVPTYGMRRGMVALDPAAVPAEHREFAATLDGLERFGTRLDLAALRAVGTVDLLVTGALALTLSGVHIGSGDAYLDLEWGLLAELGLVTDSTPIVGIVHDCQIIEQSLTPKPLDITVDLVLTPAATITPARQHRRPTGITWGALDPDRFDHFAYLRDLHPIRSEWTRT